MRDKQRIAELEGTIGALHAELKEARQAISENEFLKREIGLRDRQIVYLEGELDRIQDILYACNAEQAARLARESEIRRLAANNLSVTAIARSVYGYSGGFAFNSVKQALQT
ncbi:MAG: hypothetical protein JXA33_10895 [Anaerolineae bacterium]|nr:hypothetical protein [Anaerolineae bacterium]